MHATPDHVAPDSAPSGGVRTGAAGPRLWTILWVVLMADALDMADGMITGVAAPAITTELGGGESLFKWLGSAYALATGGLLVVGGRLGDRYGRRRMFVLGMAGFCGASVAAGLAPGPVALVGAKAAQGACAALMLPQGLAIMSRTFTGPMLARAFGGYGLLLGVVTGTAPVLAGTIIQADLGGLSWRPVYLIDLVLGAAGVVLALRLLPRDGGDRAVTVDGLGAGLLAAAAFGLLFALIEVSTNGWTRTCVLPVVAGLAFAGAFARHQATAANPLVAPSLLRNRTFTTCAGVAVAVFAATSGLLYVLSLFLQRGPHGSAREAAVAMLPLTLGVVVAAWTCSKLVTRLGGTLIVAGLVTIMAGCGALLALVVSSGTAPGPFALAPAVFVTGLGLGACTGTVFSLALGSVAPGEAGSAGGSLTALNQFASALGVTVVTSAFFHSAAPGSDQAMVASLVVVIAVTALGLPVVSRLPRRGTTAAHDRPAEG